MSLHSFTLLIPTIGSSLFVLSCLALIWFCLLTWLRTPEHKLPLGIASFILLLAIVGAIGSTTVPYAGWYAILAVPACVFIIQSAIPRLLLPTLVVRLSLGLLVLAILCVGIAPIAYATTQIQAQELARSRSATYLTKVAALLDQQSDALSNALLSASTREGMAAAIIAKDTPTIARIAQDAMVSAQLDNLTVTDQIGTVLYRAHLPTIAGDSLNTRYSWIARAEQGEAVHGIGLDETGLLSTLALQPISNQGAVLGLVYARATLSLPSGDQHTSIGLHNGADWYVIQGAVPQSLIATETFATAVRTKPYGTSLFRTAPSQYLAMSTLPAPNLLPGSPECWLVSTSYGN